MAKQPIEQRRLKDHQLYHILKDKDSTHVFFRKQGAVTEALVTINFAGNKITASGFAKHNPADKFDLKVGQRVALWRALDNIGAMCEEVLYGISRYQPLK